LTVSGLEDVIRHRESGGREEGERKGRGEEGDRTKRVRHERRAQHSTAGKREQLSGVSSGDELARMVMMIREEDKQAREE
jgi:hypothetical protein